MKTNLKAFRKARKLTQGELAELIGATVRQVGSWERGEAEMSLEDACDLADVFDCSLDELVGREVPTAPSYPDPLRNQLNGYYECMNDTGKKLAVDSIKAMSAAPELRMVKERETADSQEALGA